jgi:hypothetical protein
VYRIRPKLYITLHKVDKVTLEEIKVIFIEIFRDGIRKEIEKYYPSSTKAK